MIRILLRTLAAAVSLLVVSALLIAVLAFESTPRVTADEPVTISDVQRARVVLARHDPRRASGAGMQTVTLAGQDVTLLVRYAVSRWRPAAARVTLRDGAADVEASVESSTNPLGRWTNITAVLTEGPGLPRIARLTVGPVPVPAFVANAVARWLLDRAPSGTPLAVARATVRRVRFQPDSVRVEYVWQGDAGAQIGNMLVPAEDVQRLEAYNAELARQVETLAPDESLSLAVLLRPMLALAAQRSASGDTAGEHRAVIATLALYVTGVGLERWIAPAAGWSRPARRRVTLGGRDDLAKHFLVSAVVASQSGSALADVVGVTKEVDDSRGGTGFSFVDIAADRAGRRFGELAVHSAQTLQGVAGKTLAEDDFMPAVSGLPESMSAPEFETRFGGVGAPRYDAVLQIIDARLDRLRLFR